MHAVQFQKQEENATLHFLPHTVLNQKKSSSTLKDSPYWEAFYSPKRQQISMKQIIHISDCVQSN